MMPKMNGLDAGREIVKAGLASAVVLLTVVSDECQIAAALRAGFRAYVVKTQAPQDLVLAIREALRGHFYLGSGLSRVVVDGYLSGAKAPAEVLSPRERQVLQLVGEGKSSKEIAKVLDIGVRTVESYRAHLMEKLRVHETAGLVRYAIRLGVIEP